MYWGRLRRSQRRRHGVRWTAELGCWLIRGKDYAGFAF